VYEVYDFNFQRGVMAVAGAPGTCLTRNGLRVATKFPGVAADYFDSLGVTVELIKLNGSVELAPLVGLSDVIVDIVSTGATLRQNGLDVLAKITDFSARLIVNRVSMKLHHARVTDIIRKLKQG
jgi:ATP phosphoribosyltransferase